MRTLKTTVKAAASGLLTKSMGHRRVRHLGRWINITANGDALGSDWYRNGEGMAFEAVINDRTRGAIFEVGANDGTHTLAMLKSLDEHRKDDVPMIHSFEPSSYNAGVCRDKILEVGKQSQVVVNQLACSDREGVASLRCWDQVGGGVNSLHDRVAEPSDGQHTEAVALVRLDDYAKRNGIDQILFLKIDTEGHDYAVLQGCQQLLKCKAIKYVQFEYNATWIPARRFLKDVFDLMLPLGYQIGKIHKDFIERFVKWDYRMEWFEETNYLVWQEGANLPLPMLITEEYFGNSRT